MILSLSHVQLLGPHEEPYQAPLSMGQRQEYWSGQSFLFPGDLSNPGIKIPTSILQAVSLLTESPDERVEIIRN